jgi:hypothetical protein
MKGRDHDGRRSHTDFRDRILTWIVQISNRLQPSRQLSYFLRLQRLQDSCGLSRRLLGFGGSLSPAAGLFALNDVMVLVSPLSAIHSICSMNERTPFENKNKYVQNSGCAR